MDVNRTTHRVIERIFEESAHKEVLGSVGGFLGVSASAPNKSSDQNEEMCKQGEKGHTLQSWGYAFSEDNRSFSHIRGQLDL